MSAKSSSGKSGNDDDKAPTSARTENIRRGRQNVQNEMKDLIIEKKSELSKVLNEIKGDIVEKLDEEAIKSTSVSPELKKSETQLIDSYYIQQRNKFIKTTNPNIDQNINKSDSNLWLNTDKLGFRSPLDVALLFQRRVISPFFIACHGFLAGVAVMQLVLAYYLISGHNFDQTTSETVFRVYQQLALVGPSCFAFFISICFMSILDRVDLFHIFKCDPRDWISYRRSWVIGLIYFCGLVINAVCFRYDHMISHYPSKDPTIVNFQGTSSPEVVTDWYKNQSISSLVSTWQILNAVRCVCAILGWILLCFSQTTDLLADHLHEVKTFDLETDDKIVIDNRPS
ncbi:unnamed protein product [Bemisia tabaci]|uniref:Transmembrane protein n=1 Tax=Bemisia tabaci TaxID=7038 RepID=A0A9P0EYJ2_BEMTA|nr:PREDICTED: transmembrane protein 237 [Bemisia tabaci]XP_018900148.1 PREDICTED: transmembrane protein 237 [Bemisia tabaci]CAH0384555.1 unnamed protein product [Bemisia tabaci]